MVDQPLKGLAQGSLAFIAVLIVSVAIVAFIFRKGQTCYAGTFTTILVIMGYIMWACTYMHQMFPLITPEYRGDE